MQLRPYQQAAVDAVYEHLRSKDNNPCIVLPTASGKSIVLAKITQDAVEKWSGRVLILAHVKELLEQNSEKIRKLCPDLRIGVYSAGLKSRDTSEQVIVAGIHAMRLDPEVQQLRALRRHFPAGDRYARRVRAGGGAVFDR